MRTCCKKKPLQWGFTLFEVIITIIIAGVLATVLIPFGQKFLTGNVDSVNAAENLLQARSVMENITSDYIYLLKNNPDPMATLQEKIEAEQSIPGLYGKYELLANEFITFTPSSGSSNTFIETGSSDKHLLKVTIRVGMITLTNIFGE